MNLEIYDKNKSQTSSETDSFTNDRYKQFSTFMCEDLTILDIGCNTGRGGMVLKEIYPSLNLFGIEIISERIQKIPLDIYQNVFNESIVEWTSDELKFDRIIAGEVIEHIPEESFLQMLLQCKRLLKENGLILFTTPNPNSFLVKLGRKSVLNDPSHINIMSVNKFKSIVEKSGLIINKIIGSGKAIRFIGSKIPLLNLYGSYLAILSKN